MSYIIGRFFLAFLPSLITIFAVARDPVRSTKTKEKHCIRAAACHPEIFIYYRGDISLHRNISLQALYVYFTVCKRFPFVSIFDFFKSLFHSRVESIILIVLIEILI